MKNLKRLIYVKLARRMSKNDGAPVPTIIGESSRLLGNIESDGMIHVDGTIEGDVTCDELIIGVKGMVAGSVTTSNLQLFGTLKGKAKADNLFIAKSAKLMGDATHNTIAIEPGAYIDGHCIRNNNVVAFEQKQEVVVPIVVKSAAVGADNLSAKKNSAHQRKK
ncbi:MAG: polymer-forming cytoskeletal protein [Alphaproteobacteria bacterium]|nr:polymer-forming cytoskeletal protein [Alphaproteobacteria bacterium]MBQ9234908.1 polymer-forming cytoskeletal protein [Alphaproteobacteria bacterium]